MASDQAIHNGTNIRVGLGTRNPWSGKIRTYGGAEGNRTPDLLDANETRYQLRYSPVKPDEHNKLPGSPDQEGRLLLITNVEHAYLNVEHAGLRRGHGYSPTALR